MPDIRYVCLSDMHLGSDSSILTLIKPDRIDIDPSQSSPVMSQLVTCLKELISHNESSQKPILILNGDILEMALAETNDAAMVFERFIELIFPKDGEGLFDKNILYIPGNHDHHIWETARETQYVNFISRIPSAGYLEIPWHTTKMFSPDLVRGYFLTDLIARYPHLQDAIISIIYPNYALLSSDGQKCVIFNHGHYVESLYSLMSTLNTMIFPKRQRPRVVGDLEAENFAWIDFFWSTMGRSGDVGRDIGLVYDKLQDEKQFDKLLANLSSGLVERSKPPRWIEGVEKMGLTWIFEYILSRTGALERNKPAQLLSQDAQQGLHSYIEGPLLEQIHAENKQNLPPDITFIFGHTHKPFSQDMNFAGYPDWMKVYNSGGWVIDTVQPQSIYGAAVILLDETLQATSVRLYNQANSPGEYVVRVEGLTHDGSSTTNRGSTNTFYERINSLVKPSSDPWKTFSELVAKAVGIHEQVLQTKINM